MLKTSSLKTLLNTTLFSILLFLCVNILAAPAILTKLDTPQPAPDFHLIDLDNQLHTLEAYRGKPLIINFWATWCPPCRAELPAFNRAWSKVKDKGIQMLAVNVGEDPNTIYSFIKEFPIDFKVLLDIEADSLAAWQMQGLPTTYVLNVDGKVVFQAIGEREWDSDEILDEVKKLKQNTTQAKSSSSK